MDHEDPSGHGHGLEGIFLAEAEDASVTGSRLTFQLGCRNKTYIWRTKFDCCQDV